MPLLMLYLLLKMYTYPQQIKNYTNYNSDTFYVNKCKIVAKLKIIIWKPICYQRWSPYEICNRQ